MANSAPRIVIIGAGFSGIQAASALSGADAEILIIDRNNYHTFLPLLYQVASAEIEPEAISRPVRSIFRNRPNLKALMAEVHGIDLASRELSTSESKICYDYLILAAGSSSRFFDIPGAEEHAFQLKSLDNAISLRNHIMCCFERAAGETDRALRIAYLTFAVIGGGATGVEFAGALAELIQRPIIRDYPMLDLRDIRVVLIEGRHKLLPEMPDSLSGYVLKTLRKRGIDIHLDTSVRSISPDGIQMDGNLLACKTAVWTAGVQGSNLARDAGLPPSKDGRVKVLPTLQAPGHPEVYVCGDLAYWEEQGRPLPFTAPVAVQQGKTAGINVMRQLAGQPPLEFHYRSKGSAAVVGRGAAIINLSKRRFTGFTGWLLWLTVHIFNLIGFRNRIMVMINWAWDFFFYERGNRLILPSEACQPSKKRTASYVK